MRKIDRLYLKAVKAKAFNSKSLCLAFVSKTEEGCFEAKGVLWDGKPQSMQDDDLIISLHETHDEAIEAIYKLAEQYPNKKEVRIIINDYDDM